MIDEKSCTALAQNVDIEVLNMSMCYGVGERELKVIVEGCKKLDSWNLAWTDLSADAVSWLCSKAPPTLQRINISGCRATLKDDRKFPQSSCCGLFDKAAHFFLLDVLALCQRCPNLVELDISDATAVTSESVNYIHEYLTRLEYLAMARCYNVNLSVYL